MSKRAAIVLSGGKASRFQMPLQAWQDKALATFKDKPLLLHIIENVTPEVDEIIICVDNEERKAKYNKFLEKHVNVKIVVDEKTGIGGPNTAIFTGLKATKADHCITIPCDMPFVKPEITNYLFNRLEKEDFDIVTPIWPNGMLEILIMVLQRSIGLEITQTLCQLKRPRPSDIPRATAKSLLVSPLKIIKTLDPTLKSFININTQEDLKKLHTRNFQGTIQHDIFFNKAGVLVSDLQLMREAAKLYVEHDFVRAQEGFDLCVSRFECCDLFFWVALASEWKGEALLKHIQLQKTVNLQVNVDFDLECKKEFLNAISNYHKEAILYEKNHCIRLLERVLADKENIKTRFQL